MIAQGDLVLVYLQHPYQLRNTTKPDIGFCMNVTHSEQYGIAAYDILCLEQIHTIIQIDTISLIQKVTETIG